MNHFHFFKRSLAAIGCLILMAGCTDRPPATPVAVDAKGPATIRDWPMHRGAPDLRGLATGSIPARPSVLWEFDTGEPVTAPAAISGGKVFVGSGSGVFYALDFVSGKELWRFKTEAKIEAAPLVQEDWVLIGSADFSVYSLETETGKLRWKRATGERVLAGATPVELKGGTAIAVGSYDGKLYCLDPNDGAVLWTLETGSYINATPGRLDGGLLGFGGCDSHFYVVRAEDGTLEHKIELEAYVASSAACLGSFACVGHYGNEALGVDAAAGKVVWQYRDKSFPFFSSPALTADRAVLGSRDKAVHALDAFTGERLWRFETRGRVDSSPVICGDAVLVGSQDGRLYAINLADGALRWEYQLGGPLTASPAVRILEGDKVAVVIGSEDGKVYSIAEGPNK